MNPRTLIAVLVLVAGLGALAWFELRRDAAAPPPGEQALLEGFDRSRVRSVRIDQIRYSLQMELRVDAGGRWRIVDPIDFPADEVVVAWLLDALSQNRAADVPSPDPQGLGLRPPRAVIEVREDVGGRERVRRLELGLVDVDGQHLFVRVDGRIVRTLANLDSVLDRPRDLWRARQVLDLDPRSVVELSRRGKIGARDGSELHDLELDAWLGPAGWTAVRPFEGALEPTRVMQWLHVLCGLRASSFVDEASGRLDVAGLDRPDVELSVVDAAGSRVTLALRRDRATPDWFALRSDRPHVWRLDALALEPLFAPTEELVDRQLVRVPKADVDQVHLVTPEGELWLERSAGRWIVWEGDESGRGRSAPADAGAAELLVGELVRTGFVQRVVGREFESDDARSGVWLRAGGAPFGGRLGREVDTPEGGHGFLFRRDGESLVFLADPRLVELARTSRASLESRQVVRLREVELARASIVGRGGSRRYVRAANGRWSPEGVDQEAREFALSVDRLIGLAAVQWIDPADGGALADPIEVTFTDGFGNVTPYVLGFAGERAAVDFAGRRAEVDPAVHAAVAALLGR